MAPGIAVGQEVVVNSPTEGENYTASAPIAVNGTAPAFADMEVALFSGDMPYLMYAGWFKTQADANGNWSVTMNPPQSGWTIGAAFVRVRCLEVSGQTDVDIRFVPD